MTFDQLLHLIDYKSKTSKHVQDHTSYTPMGATKSCMLLRNDLSTKTYYITSFIQVENNVNYLDT